LHVLIISDDHPSDQLIIMLIKSAISWSVCQLLLAGKCKSPLLPCGSFCSIRIDRSTCSSVKPMLQLVGGRVDPAGRMCAANVGESELAPLSLSVMRGWRECQIICQCPIDLFRSGHSPPLRASKCLKNPVSLVWN